MAKSIIMFTGVFPRQHGLSVGSYSAKTAAVRYCSVEFALELVPTAIIQIGMTFQVFDKT
jgi:hypothetical protein